MKTFCSGLLLALCLVIGACGGKTTDPQICAPQGKLSVYCDIQSPEDIEWLPDGSGLLLSEFGHLGDVSGRISLLDPVTGLHTILYDGNQPRSSITGHIWGEIDCVEPETFSPHGFHLSERSNGRWQLLVVNHEAGRGAVAEDSIQMFELAAVDDHWYLDWRGCAQAEKGRLLNDVVAAGSGFYATQMAEKNDALGSFLDHVFKRRSSVVLRWKFADGWQEIEGTRGTQLNGIQWHAGRRELFVSEWSKNRVNVFDYKGRRQGVIPVPGPDNISYDANKDIFYVTGNTAGILELGYCLLKPDADCHASFRVTEFDPKNYTETARLVFEGDGDYFGAGTTAVAGDGALYIGSFAGHRLLRVGLVD